MIALSPPPLLCRPRGFTLVELLLVVMVLGLMAGVAAPRYRAALEGMALECAAKRLAADLRYARQEAIRRSLTLGIEFLPGAGLYQTLTEGGVSLGSVDHPGEPLMVRLGAARGRVSIAATAFPTDTIRFDFRGDPSASGSVDLTNGTTTVSVRVNAAGEVDIAP